MIVFHTKNCMTNFVMKMPGNNWRTARNDKRQKFQANNKVSTVVSSRTQNNIRTRLLKRQRNLSKEALAKMRTLQNPMLYNNLIKRLKTLNPDIGSELIDRIDRTLEYDEALNDLKKKMVNLITNKIDIDNLSMKEYRDWLEEEWGISNVHIQNLVMRDDKPATEEDLAQLARAIHGRSAHAKKIDRAMKAPLAKNFRQYANNPNRTDIIGLDTRGTKTDPLEDVGK